MPVYNASKFLREAIDSILSQTYTDLELLIINDGSTDDSEQIIVSYSDPRIRYVKNESNLRLIATLNKGIGLTDTPYIVRMDADDISLPDRIALQVAYMDLHPDVALCGSGFRTMGLDDITSIYDEHHDDIMYQMLYQCRILHPTIIMRTSMIKPFPMLFDPAFIHAEDYDFFVRLGQRYRLANVAKVLLRYRHHPDSISQKHKEIQKENSNIIRHRQFQTIGYDPTPQQLSDFAWLNYQHYGQVVSSPDELRTFLEAVIEANGKSKVLDHELLKKRLSTLWFSYCYHITTIEAFYRSSVLTTYVHPTLVQRMKWGLRRWLK